MAKPAAGKKSKPQAPAASSKKTASSKIPAPFVAAPSELEPFLATLDPEKVYITHIDTLPWQFKRKIFSVPVALNVAIVVGLAYRFVTALPFYLDLMLLVLGYPSKAAVSREGQAMSALLLIVVRRALTIAADFVLFRFIGPWPVLFFGDAPASAWGWRWRIGFRETEIVVRLSRRWGCKELFEGFERGVEENEIMGHKVLPAIDPAWMHGRTGYLMMGKEWDLDFWGMICAEDLMEKKTMAVGDFEKTVIAWDEGFGWVVWQVGRLDKGNEDEARRKIVQFKDRLTAMGKESLFFRWIELIQYESSQPGGFTQERQEEAVRKAKELFEGQGIDFEEFLKELGGVDSMPGMPQ